MVPSRASWVVAMEPFVPKLGITVRFEDDDDGFFFMNVEFEVVIVHGLSQTHRLSINEQST